MKAADAADKSVHARIQRVHDSLKSSAERGDRTCLFTLADEDVEWSGWVIRRRALVGWGRFLKQELNRLGYRDEQMRLFFGGLSGSPYLEVTF